MASWLRPTASAWLVYATRCKKSASPEIREALRALIAKVEVHPAGDGKTEHRIEPVGHLASLLRAGGAKVRVIFLFSAREDAGTRNRRRQYLEVAI